MNKDTKFYIPDIYPNHIIKDMLNGLGFTSVTMLEPLVKCEIETGIFFNHQTPESLSAAIKRFDNFEFHQQKLIKNAKQFSTQLFLNQNFSTR